MQFTTIILTLASSATIVSAAAIPVDAAKTGSATVTRNSIDDKTTISTEDHSNDFDGPFDYTKRSASPEAEAEARWCGRRGEPCWVKVKRSAIPEAEARWCGRRGEPCWVKVKRDADAAPEPLPAALADAAPEAEARWCGRRGEPCWVKVKRDADVNVDGEDGKEE